MADGGGGSGFGTIPGDPGAIRSAAGRIGTLAAAVADCGSSLTSVAGGLVGGGWTGTAASQFDSASGQLAGAHHQVESGLAGVPAALTAFASTLERCQHELARANTLMSQADDDYSSSLGSLDSAFPPHVLSTTPGAAGQRQLALNSINDTYNTQTTQATNLANTALNDHRTAVAQLQSHLEHSSDEAHGVVGLLTKVGDSLGVPVAVVSGLATVAMLRAAARFATTGSAFAATVADESKTLVSTLAGGLLNHTLTPEEAVSRLESFITGADGAESLFRNSATQDLASGGLNSIFGGLSPAVGRVAGGLGIIGDAFTIWHPDQGGAWGTAERVVAGGNAVGTGGLLAADGFELTAAGGLLAADGTLGWVPVAGQVLVVGSAVYLAGDYLYTHVKWFHDGINTVGHGISTGVKDFGHGVSDVGHGIASGLSSAAHFIGL